MTVNELLRLACIYAERDQEELLRAVAGDVEQETEIRAYLKQLREYRLKRWGKTKLETTLETLSPVPISELAARPNQPCCEWLKPT